ncbi:MAG: AarF/ABC1/UbiB kinase family protein [Candidatus Contendobacter sp.]|nr:AarF/ABC1/UbiB kinase family protein [Candidatus Contendobacter sp.]
MPYASRLLDWSAFAEKLRIAQLAPEAYAAYHPLLSEGLRFFLERLSPPRRARILAEQLQLPHTATPAHRLVTLLRQCPTLHKLGQVVARDQRLSRELRENLQGLESLAPTTPLEAITAIIRQEWGQVAGLEVASEALAEASVAVVVPFVWRDSQQSAPRQGVFKVLRPGIEEQMHEELAIWSALGPFLEEHCAIQGLPALDYRNTLDSVCRLLANEIRLDHEQTHLARAATFYAHSPTVLIPSLLPFCTARMTAMERVEGCKVTAAEASPGERHRLAKTLIEALIAQPFWSNPQSDAYFHADPHAGNLFLTRDGRLAILDWALVTPLSKAQRVAAVQTVVSALMQDEAGASRSIASLGRSSDPAALRSAVAAGLRQVRQGTFPGMNWLMALLDRLGTAGAMQFPEELTLFRKALLTLSGVIRDVSAQPSIDEALILTGLTQCFRELATRGLAPFDSRAFGSHLSNADGFSAWAGLPIAVVRYWIGAWQDALGAADSQSFCRHR